MDSPNAAKLARLARRPPAKTTTYGIVARDAPRVVVFRRGPTRHMQLLVWDLRDDTVVAGQWLVASVDPGPCGVSPNGELLVYDARRGATTYTAVSRPPYFTALAYLPYSSPWTGGGFFTSDTSIVLGHRYTEADRAGRFPPHFAVTDVWTYFAGASRAGEPLSAAADRDPLAQHGWTMSDRGATRKPNPRRLGVVLERTRSGRQNRVYSVVGEAGTPSRLELGIVDWADWAHDGSLLSGRAGRLYRQELPKVLTEVKTPSLVADLTTNVFTEVEPPPNALVWPGARPKRARK